MNGFPLDLTGIKTCHFSFPLMRYHRYTLAAILARMKVERRANGQTILFKLELWRLLGNFSFPILLLQIFLLLSLNNPPFTRKGRVQKKNHRSIIVSFTKAPKLPVFQLFLVQSKTDLGATVFNKTEPKIPH